MTARDRMVVIVVAALGVLAAVWLLAVAPERQQAAKLATEVSAAQAQLASAESQVSSAAAARARYETAYASIVRLGKAVPAGQEVPSLIYQLAQATNQKNVEFASITTTVPGTGSSPAASSPAASPSAASASATAGAGFTQMPFTFVFNGGFDSLYSLFQQLDGFALHTSAGGLRVSGRLLTIQSVKLAPVSESSSSKGNGSEQLSGTITATAYVLPAGQTLTGGASAAGPTGTTTQTASTGASSSPNPPAVARVTP
jgi:Tfp pilus assembly protein PilO